MIVPSNATGRNSHLGSIEQLQISLGLRDSVNHLPRRRRTMAIAAQNRTVRRSFPPNKPPNPPRLARPSCPIPISSTRSTTGERVANAYKASRDLSKMDRRDMSVGDGFILVLTHSADFDFLYVFRGRR